MGKWPFDEPENVVTLTVRQVMDGRLPILLVVHDADDGTWQFLTGGPFEIVDGMLVSLRRVYHLDPSIGELADLPLGWSAERKAREQPWKRQPSR